MVNFATGALIVLGGVMKLFPFDDLYVPGPMVEIRDSSHSANEHPHKLSSFPSGPRSNPSRHRYRYAVDAERSSAYSAVLYLAATGSKGGWDGWSL